ncbi:hypothetical protein ElyMa_003672200 [Elysia marginata]|uniref:Uncharacterized protein n=1 Tax=Elysia marginata TaxID=1093978 RepID=A0AAV4EYE0_9GAST|nr:hypothetical protein ElyMa_003672200 [Elysia marginata]
MRRWRWIGHTKRSSNRHHSEIYSAKETGVGLEKWKRCVKIELILTGKGWGKLEKLAQNRSGWHLLVHGLYHVKDKEFDDDDDDDETALSLCVI